MSDTKLFPEAVDLRTRIPATLDRAVRKVAAQRLPTKSELTRQALLREVESAGITLDERVPCGVRGLGPQAAQ
jgi:hypothetical protein